MTVRPAKTAVVTGLPFGCPGNHGVLIPPGEGAFFGVGNAACCYHCCSRLFCDGNKWYGGACCTLLKAIVISCKFSLQGADGEEPSRKTEIYSNSEVSLIPKHFSVWLITDRISAAGDAIASVRPFVSSLSSQLTDRWPSIFACE